MTKRRALLSVFDKTGIAEFGRALVDRDWEILSTGGTARALRDEGLPVTDVSEVTAHPEMMEGRVKTLHPAIHAGILARREREDDLEALREQGYGTIDLVAVNLYPFRETIARGNVPVDAAMKQVDIGGPTMIRAAAKSHRDVWVVVEPADYARVLEALDRSAADGAASDTTGSDAAASGDPASGALRQELAAKVFGHVSEYDRAIADYLGAPSQGPSNGRTESHVEEGAGNSGPPTLPPTLTLSLERRASLRYGENPAQAAGFYVPEGAETAGIASLEQKHGKDLSYNNLLDLDGALLSLSPFAFSDRPTVAIIKHTTPCGLAVGSTLAAAYRRALATDPVSAFGSVIATNRPMDGETAGAIAEHFVECIVAPSFSQEAIDVLTKKQSLRLLVFPGLRTPIEFEPVEDSWWEDLDDGIRGSARFLAAHSRHPSAMVVRSVYGGALVQTPPLPPFYRASASDATSRGATAGLEWTVATAREPTEGEWDDLRFAWAAVFGVKSNAILLARDGATIGIGAGQMSRVDSSKIAVRKAREAGLDIEGAVLASDAFFPFRDGVDAAAEAGVRAIVQPGGSIRDEEVIEAADEHGIAMVFTGERVFRH